MYDFRFTYQSLENQLRKAVSIGYSFMTIEEYYEKSKKNYCQKKLSLIESI